MSSNKIKITVAGTVGSGKSTIANAILLGLAGHGLIAKINDDRHRLILPHEITRNITQLVINGGLEIEIETIQVMRENLSND